MEIPLSLIEEGMDVLLCDCDAVWLADPLPGFVHPSEADIGGSIVTHRKAHPREARTCWGFTICTGWVLFRSRSSTVAHMRDLLNTGYYRPDGWGGLPRGDQGAFNGHLVWRGPAVSATLAGGYLLDVPEGRGVDGAALPPLKVKVLNDRAIHRGDRREGDYVCHPLSPKTGRATEKKLREEGLWFAGEGVPSFREKIAASLPLPASEG
jgi:hypothetical protein